MVQSISKNSSWGTFRNRRGLVTQTAIRRMAQEIASRFAPQRIMLFGSYAAGHARPDSDVDVLVIMPARNEIGQSLRIEESLDSPFSLDVVVRTPKNLARRLREGDWFLKEAVAQGKVLYEQPDEGMYD